MSAVTPSTDLYLLQCPIERDNRNQINFANATAQFNYFNGLTKIGETNFTYQRKDNTIRYPAHIDTIRHYNYVMYRNDNYSNKWFYAFIEGMEYLNDNVTLIKIKTDVYQTWQFDLTFKRSFVEREHVNDDTVGKHTIDETLPTGEPIINRSSDFVLASASSDNQRIVAQVTQLPDGVTPPADTSTRSYRVYNGIPQGCYFVVFDGATSRNKFVKWYDVKGQADAIVSMFIAPDIFVSSADYQNYTIGEGIGSTRVGFLDASWGTYNYITPIVSRPTALDGYVPKNNKMFSYPFSYLHVSNNAGSNIIYRYEDFNDSSEMKWACKGVLTQGCSIKLYPVDYKRYTGSALYDYGITGAKLPILSWASDFYLNWQAQNGSNNTVQAVLGVGRGAMGSIASASMGAAGTTTTMGAAAGVGAGIFDALGSIQNAMQAEHVAQLTPDQARGNVNVGDLTYSMGKCAFTFQCMSCRSEVAVMIDNYFSMFGYKVNDVKVPNLTGRLNWNYIKTINANIEANAPQEDIDEIKSMFDTGITIWHNPATYLDYSQNNPIV